MSREQTLSTKKKVRDDESSEAESGLIFGPATEVEEVIAAWELVYVSYRRIGLIGQNSHQIHTVAAAIHPDTAVIVGKIRSLVVSTMSAYLDREGGLPLDAVYRDELDGLRESGCSLMEVGLFADRREKITRSLAALMELMRYTFFYAVHREVSDIVIGVHPHHAGFYKRCFAFKEFGDVAGCPSVNGSPMTPLRLDIQRELKADPLPKGLAYFMRDPLEGSAFDDRLQLDRGLIGDTRIGAFFEQCEASEGDQHHSE